jgi:hypothetical protein
MEDFVDRMMFWWQVLLVFRFIVAVGSAISCLRRRLNRGSSRRAGLGLPPLRTGRARMGHPIVRQILGLTKLAVRLRLILPSFARPPTLPQRTRKNGAPYVTRIGFAGL